MTYCIISGPETVCDPADAREIIAKKNSALLLESEFPTALPELDAKTLIGDPEDAFPYDTCDMLVQHGVLERTPVLDDKGKQQVHDSFGPLWNYFWGEAPFSVLSIEELAHVAWDLRYHQHFVHASIVEEPTELLAPVELGERLALGTVILPETIDIEDGEED